MNRVRATLELWRYVARHRAIKTALGALALLALVNLGALSAWWPAAREHRDIVARIEAQRRATVEAMQAADVARAFRAASKAAEILEQKLNAAGGQSDLVKGFERIAAKRNVRIIATAYEEAKPQGAYSPLYLDVGLQASYASLREFLADIHALPVWIEIQELNLESTRERPGLIKANLRLLTYRQAAKREVARAP